MSDVGGIDVSLVERTYQRLRHEGLFWNIRRALKEEIIKPKHRVEDLQSVCSAAMETMELGDNLKNAIHRILEEGMSPMGPMGSGSECDGNLAEAQRQPLGEDEPVAFVAEAKRKWEELVLRQLKDISKEQELPFARRRSDATEEERHHREERLERMAEDLPFETPRTGRSADSMSSPRGESPLIDEVDPIMRLPPIRFAFTPKLLLDMMGEIKAPNMIQRHRLKLSWGMLSGFELHTPSLSDLQDLFPEFALSERHVGMDDLMDSWYQAERLEKGKKIGALMEAREYGKRGIPTSLRPKIWKLLLSLRIQESDKLHFESLTDEVQGMEYLVDDLVRMDIFEVVNDDTFFLFDEVLERVLLPLERDPYLHANMRFQGIEIVGTTNVGTDTGAYPPSTLIPFQGLALIVAPLCFVYGDIVDVYYVFREFFCKHICGLQSWSSSSETILVLCKTFEKLLYENVPEVCYHFEELGIRPLELVFPWIFHAFAGHLSVGQTLLLWDRVLSYGSLMIVPVLAVAILAFRKKQIVKADTISTLIDVLSDNTQLMIVPLLQQFLFGEVGDIGFGSTKN
eukprot:TRINITY_DN34607_c0_g1_i1.p1 TRINITY_DN34607_c0_g1~~TRINITY_DN34607_c0_g1_i1.p1  ORF type:complete len:601 (-),score=175.66 TRINITY_DN34607_c0_g1_i1:7-1716(-)